MEITVPTPMTRLAKAEAEPVNLIRAAAAVKEKGKMTERVKEATMANGIRRASCVRSRCPSTLSALKGILSIVKRRIAKADGVSAGPGTNPESARSISVDTATVPRTIGQRLIRKTLAQGVWTH